MEKNRESGKVGIGKRVSVLLIVFLFIYPQKLLAEIVTKCGASKGWAYYIKGGLVPNKEVHTWKKDEIPNGSFLLDVKIENGKNKYNIFFKDATDRMISYEEQGFGIVGSIAENGNILVAAISSSPAIEHFIFELDKKGNGQVIWGAARAGGVLPKSSVSVATCAAP